MAAIVVVGAQWGDEGKGKIVDLISARAEMVVRFAGGANAGHTLKVGGQKLVTHLLPSGVMHPGARCVLGAGVVVAPEILAGEIATCETKGLGVTERLLISRRAHVTFPFQSAIDRAANAGPRSIGTTGRGIGPTYSDKAARIGVRLGDLVDPARANDRVGALVEVWAERARAAGVEAPTVAGALAWVAPYMAVIGPLLGDASIAVDEAIKAGKRVVFEGAQGTLLDLDHGTYPFVTSSNTVSGGACTGVGVGPTRITGVVGITKAYCTRVGHGLFPTELLGEAGERLREVGEEYGATTGRPRRCGWLDLPALRYAARVNGLTALAVTKVDVLAGLAEVPLCVAYRVDGVETQEFPIDDLDRAEPVFLNMPGWDASVSEARTMEALPETVRRYLTEIEARTGVEVAIVSIGAERDATIVRREVLV
ncbi:MAG: adenylosuccinate synthase [Myxococcaceae bacterium]|nr:MAG: adenylosuccinate synthase [Myxococcaceae bacterium]